MIPFVQYLHAHGTECVARRINRAALETVQSEESADIIRRGRESVGGVESGRERERL